MSQIYDVLPEVNDEFPAHGWINNVKNVRVLFLPVIQLYQYGQKYHKYFIDNHIGGVWLQSRSPERTLRNLAVCFRDIHKEVREITPLFDLFQKEKTDKQKSLELTRQIEGTERLEILVISAFTLLRRLADELINASCPFLFEDWKSAPGNMKKAILSARKDKLKQFSPICNLDILNDALCNYTNWFEILIADDGIRDILIHKPHILQIAGQGSGKPGKPMNWRATADLTRMSGLNHNLVTVDLFPYLVKCIDGACKFMERLCLSVGLASGYKREGFIFFTGQDNDVVGLWPPIEGSRLEFPIME